MKITNMSYVLFCLFVVLGIFPRTEARVIEAKIQPFSFPKDLSIGRNVKTFCAVEGGDKIFSFEWLKDGEPLMEQDNVFIRVEDEFTLLEIEPVTLNDNGNYTCKVRVDMSDKSLTHTAQLLVTAPPVWVKEPFDQQIELGSTVSLDCLATGNPVPTISWSKLNKILDGQDNYVLILPDSRIKQFRNGTLALSDMKKDDEGQYRCLVFSEIGQNISKVIVVSVYGKPKIQPFPLTGDQELGKPLKLVCTVSEGTKPLKFKWAKDGSELSSGNSNCKIEMMKELSVLTVSEVRVQDSGNYTCSVENSYGLDSFTSILTVKAPPQWMLKPHNRAIMEGSKLTLDCQVASYPPARVTWRRNTQSNSETSLQDLKLNETTKVGKLTIFHVTKQDEGRYLCTADNGVGPTLKQEIVLTVLVPARFEEKFGVVTAQKGESARLQCNAQGDQPLSVTWSNSSNTLSKTSGSGYEIFETLTPKGINSELIIRETLPQDGAIYSCLAENEHGRDERKVKLLIQEVPSPPPGVSVREVWTRSSSITWLVPYSGNSPISNYIVQYWRDHKRTRRLNEKTVPSSQTFAMIKNLQPGTSYIVTIIAENSVGKSLPSDPAMLTTGEEEPDAPPMDISVHAKGTNTITVMWKAPPHENWNGQLKGYYVGYRVIDLSETYSYETEQFSPNLEHDHFLTNLMKGTKYGIIVKAFNAAGTGPPTQEILVSTLDGDLPASPKLYVQSTTRSTVTLKWDVDSPSHASVTGYTIQYRRESGRWHQATTVPLENNYYTVTGLQDDTVYEFYVTAANKYGAGDPSEIITVITGDIDSGFASSLSGHHGHGYMDLAIIVPVAAAVAAVGVVVAVSCVWQRKIRLRHRLERAMSERTYTPYAGIPVGQVTVGQCFPDMDKTWPPGHSDNNPPISNPDPYSAVPPRIQNGDLRKASSTQEMRTYFTQDTRIQGLSGSKQDVRQIRNSQYSNSLK